MDSLFAEYDQLREKNRQLSELYGKLSDEVAKIAGYTENLDIFWDGDANSAYMLKVSEDLAVAGGLLLRIRKTIRAADKAFSAYMSAESTVRNIIAGYRTQKR